MQTKSNVNQVMIDWLMQHPDERQVCIMFCKADVEALIDREIHLSDWNKLSAKIEWYLPDDHMWEVLTQLSEDLKQQLDDLSEYERNHPSEEN